MEADEDKPPSPVDDSINDEDIPPRQMRLWNEDHL
jgi:hypothetical protein